MLCYDGTDASEGTDLAESNSSKECVICHYWYFNHGFKFQDFVNNGCHVFKRLSANIRDIAIITIKNVDSWCIICNISKTEAINLLENSALKIVYEEILSQSTPDSFFFTCFALLYIKWLTVWTSISLLMLVLDILVKAGDGSNVKNGLNVKQLPKQPPMLKTLMHKILVGLWVKNLTFSMKILLFQF